jgi:hypothetical protein
VVKTYACGDFFGEMALTDWLGVRAATVRAGHPHGATCLVLGREAFERHVAGNAGAEAVIEEVQRQYEFFTVPEGLEGGDVVVVTAPDGREMEVTVPEGMQQGEEFEVDVTPRAAGSIPAVALGDEEAAPQQQEQQQQQQQQKQQQEEEEEEEEESVDADVITVTVPEGAIAGDVIVVETPAGLELEIEVPKGCVEGEEFEVTTPRA